MDTLHKNVYDISKAISALVPQGGPVLCRDEMEEWSASEANLFEEALEKYGKDFTDIQQDFVSISKGASVVTSSDWWQSWLAACLNCVSKGALNWSVCLTVKWGKRDLILVTAWCTVRISNHR